MAVDTAYGSRIMTGLINSSTVTLADPGEGGGRVKVWVETVETDASASTGSLYTMARLPSNVRILGRSLLSHDALGTATATINIGIYNTSSRTDFTNSATGLNTGIVASTAGDKAFIADRVNWGKRLWEYTQATSDPKCEMDIKLALATANLSSGAGTMTVEIYYTYD